MDVESSQMLGMLSTGAWRNAVEFLKPGLGLLTKHIIPEDTR